jgi:hypothetical protein
VIRESDVVNENLQREIGLFADAGVADRRASYSGGSGTNCVEAAIAEAGRVLVRDTTDRDGAMLSISADAWARFTDSLR